MKKEDIYVISTLYVHDFVDNCNFYPLCNFLYSREWQSCEFLLSIYVFPSCAMYALIRIGTDDICGVEITENVVAVNENTFRKCIAFLLGNEVDTG